MPIPFLDTAVPTDNFPIVKDKDVLGGFRVITWTHGSGPTDSRNAARLGTPTGVRVAQMPIRVLDVTTGLVDEFVWDGGGDTDANFVPYVPVNAASAAVYGVVSGGGLVVSGATATVPAIRLVDGAGGVFATQSDTVPTTTVSAGGTTVVFYNATLKRLEEQLLGANTMTRNDVPLKVLVRNGSNVITKVVDCTPHTSLVWDTQAAIVGDGVVPAHFDSLKASLVWRNAMARSTNLLNSGVPNKFLIATAQKPIVRTMTGTVDIFGSAITGHSSKFLSEYRAGDLFGVSPTSLVVVLSVSSNTSMTLVGSLTTVTGATPLRGEAAGPNSSMIDSSQEEFSGLSALKNLKISGADSTSSAPVVLQCGYSATDVNADPFFSFGSNRPDGWQYDDFQMKYSGAQDQTIDSHCLVKNTAASKWNRISFDSNQKWSTGFLWDTSVNLGTSIDRNTYMKLENCVFIENGASNVGASLFRSTAVLSGLLLLENCKSTGSFGSPASNVFDWGSTGSTVDARWEGGRIDNIRTSIFNHTTSLGYSGSPKDLINVQIGTNTVQASLAVVSPAEGSTSARAHVRGIQTFAPFFYRGAELVVDAKTMANVTTTLSSGGSYYGVDFTAAGGTEDIVTDGAPSIILRSRPTEVNSLTNLQIASGNITFAASAAAVINTLGASFVKARSDALALSSGCSRIMAGCEFEWDGTNIHVKPGTILFANGAILVIPTEIVAAPTITGFTGAVYIYLATNSTTVSPNITASTTAPNFRGINGSTTTSCYVGSFMAISGVANVSRAYTIGGTVRRVSPQSTSVGTAAVIGGNLTGNQLSASVSNTLMPLTAGSDALRTVLPTARSLYWDLGLFFAPLAGTVSTGTMVIGNAPTSGTARMGLSPIAIPIAPFANWLSTNGSGVVQAAQAVSPQIINRVLETENFLESPAKPVLGFTFPGSASAWSILPVSTFAGYLEDVNQPTPWV